MRRLLMVGLCLLATAARADGPQADDDEKPGSRSKPVTTHADTRLDDPDVGDTTIQRNPASAPAAPTPVAGPAAGQPHEANDGDTLRLEGKSPRGEAPSSHGEGHYNGVSMGGEHLPPKAPKLPMKGPQRMTWPGFQVRDGVPTVFLQTTGTPDYAVSETPGAVTVTLRGTTIKLRNNERPLKVAEFGTAVTEVSAKPHGHDVVVTIKRKEAGAHHERVEASAGGYQLLVVEMAK